MGMLSIIYFFFIFSTMMSQMTSHLLHRRFLHQPFFPIDLPAPASPSPSLSPQPSQQPKYPFSSSSSSSSSSSPGSINSGGGGYPFFPSDPHYPPPPPPAASLASFPANISSLVFPNSHSSDRRASAKLIATVVASVSLSALVLIIALALILHRRKTRQNAVVSHKPLRPDSPESQPRPPTMMTSDGSIKLPSLRRGVIGTSTEFLYLGTVANSQENEAIFRKPDSPELRPLPPLPKFNYFASAEQVSSSRNVENEDDDEEFFSPRGSSGSRNALRFADQIFDNGNRSFNSKTATFPYSNSRSSTTSDHEPAFSLRSPSPSSSPKIELCRPTRVSPDKIVNLPPPHPPPMPPATYGETSVGPPEKLVVEAHLEDSGLDALGRNVQPHKLKLKPLHWDTVRASSEKVMAWDQIKSNSFRLNEEIMESLFRANSTNPACQNALPSVIRENRVLDSRKAHNISILLRALNVTADEVCEALLEGNTDALGAELLESLLKMKPCKEEEKSLRELTDESPFKVDPAENFLKVLLEIPYAFERIDAMLYMTTFDSEVDYMTQSFQTLEAACDDLKKSKMFLKLLEAVLRAGNRMNFGTNRGDAHAFKLDTLLKLSDVKAADGKTTLLHFVVQEIIKDEDPIFNQGTPLGFLDEVESKKRSLQVVTSLIGELSNVKKAAEIDFTVLSSEVKKLTSQMSKVRHILKLAEELPANESNHKFKGSVTAFLNKAEVQITKVQAQQSNAFALVKDVTKYFHGDSYKDEAHSFRIFLVVRDFLSILDRACKEVGRRNQRTIVGSGSVHSHLLQYRNTNTLPVFPLPTQQSSVSVDQSSSSPSCRLTYSVSM